MREVENGAAQGPGRHSSPQAPGARPLAPAPGPPHPFLTSQLPYSPGGSGRWLDWNVHVCQHMSVQPVCEPACEGVRVCVHSRVCVCVLASARGAGPTRAVGAQCPAGRAARPCGRPLRTRQAQAGGAAGTARRRGPWAPVSWGRPRSQGPAGGGGSRGWGGRGTLAGVPPKLRVSLGAPRGGLEGRKELGARTRTDGNQRSWRPRIPGSGHLLGLGQGSPGRRPVCLVPAAGLSASGNFSLGAPSQVSPPLHSALPGAGQSP